jgi:hypothetical protein
MTLLEATITLIDAARQLPEDKTRERAIKRVEKRVRLLQLRALRARKWNRRKAFYDAVAITGGGVATVLGRMFAIAICKQCNTQLDFGDFCRCGQFNGRGKAISFFCPKCKSYLIGEPPEDEIDWGNSDYPNNPFNAERPAKVSRP